MASLDTASAQTQHPLGNNQHQPQESTDHGRRDRSLDSTEGRRPRINQHQPQSSTGHGRRDQSPDSPEDVRPEQGGIGAHRSWNRGQGAHGSPPVTAESSPHFRVTTAEDCSCYSIARLMSEGDVGCNRDGAAGQVSPVLGRYGLQHGVGRKLSCKHGGAETVASSYCTPCCQRLHTLWHFSHAGLRLVRNCSIMSREEGQTCLLPRYRFSVAASVTVMIVTSNHNSLFGSPTPRDPRSPTPWPRPCF